MKIFTLILGLVALVVIVAVTLKYGRKWKSEREHKGANNDSNKKV